MAYRYRCQQCRTTSPPVPTKAAARLERGRHRDQFHGGHIPDGEEIQTRTEPGEPQTADLRELTITLGVFVAFLVLGWLYDHIAG